MTLCIYELDAHAEADQTRWFCSNECRDAFNPDHDCTIILDTNEEWIEGTVCDECGAPLGEVSA